MQDGKNLIMAIVLCLLVVVGWSYLADYMGWVVKPDPAEIAKMEAARRPRLKPKPSRRPRPSPCLPSLPPPAWT